MIWNSSPKSGIWEEWFTWYPVDMKTAMPGIWFSVWWQKIERRRFYYNHGASMPAGSGYGSWEYRLIDKEAK